MILYNNCTFKDLFSYDADELNFYITTGLFIPENSWGLPDLTEWPYGKVMELLMYFESDIEMEKLIEIIHFATEIDREAILKKHWHEVFAFYNWLKIQAENINVMLKTLYVEPTADEQNAGIENFAPFGVFATINGLAGGDILKYEAVENTSFMIVFTKLSLNKVDAAYRQAYQDIMLHKSKHP